MSKEDETAEVLDSGLNVAVVHDLKEEGEIVVGDVGQFKGLNLLPVVVFEQLKSKRFKFMHWPGKSIYRQKKVSVIQAILFRFWTLH